MKLSEELLDAIDGGEESRGRDAQLTEWCEKARRLEAELEGYKQRERVRARLNAALKVKKCLGT